MMEIDYLYRGKIKINDKQIMYKLIAIDNSRIPVKNFELLFDTGAFITTINKDIANKYGYKIQKENFFGISGFSEKKLTCDLRKIPTVVFCGVRINDVFIATPHDDDVQVTEVLGMNILENFNFCLDLDKEEIYLNIRKDFISQKSKYKCGKVSAFTKVGFL